MRRLAALAGAAVAVVALAAGCNRADDGGGAGDVGSDGALTATEETAPATTRPVPGAPTPPPPGFPTGVFTKTVSGAPAEHALLEGRWTLVLNADGTFDLSGRFATRGRYVVRGGRVTFEHDEACPEHPGTYGWSVADGETLRFEVVDDPCGPTRQYHLATGSWARGGGG